MEIEITNYIKDARQHGLTDQEIKQNLLDVGWDSGQVEDSFAYAKMPDSEPQHNQAISAAAATVAPQQIPAKPVAEFHAPLAQQPESFEPAQIPGDSAHVPVMASQPLSLPPSHATLSDTHFQSAPAGNKRLLAIIAVIVFFILAGGGYFAYAYVYNSPQRIWDRFITNTFSQKIFTANYKITFRDPGAAGKDEQLGISAEGQNYSDNSNAENPQMDLKFKLGYQTREKSDSRDFAAILKDKVIYLDLSSIPELAQAVGQPLAWIKLDINELEKFASSTSPSLSSDKQKQIQVQLKAGVADILANKKIVKSGKLVGSETINGVPTFHLKNELDKAALKDAIIEALTKIAKNSGQDVPQKDIDDAKTQLASVFDKLDIQPVEVWIGKKDYLPYKISYGVNFDSLSSISSGFASLLTDTEIKKRDTQRLSDIKQMRNTLELYFNDHNGYPAGKDGVPQDVAPNYISVVPSAPAPGDKDCSDYYNTYWYTPTGTPGTNNGLLVYPSYEYTFCLGSDTGGYKAGIGKLTSVGIEGNIVCNDKPEYCHKITDAQVQPNTPAQKAALTIELNFSDYGKIKEITAPAESLDIIQMFMGFTHSSSTAPLY